MYLQRKTLACNAVPGLWLLLVWWLVPTVAWADTTYVVKRTDTLSSISRRYGISVSQLARHNGIAESNRILVGQRLRIPGKSAAVARSSGHSQLPNELSKVRVSGRWKSIVIHHSGVSVGDVKSMDAYHREKRRMENGLAYHFVIGNGQRMKDGEIALGNRWRKQLDGGHLASAAQNRTSIGICLVGNFEKERPTAKQLESLDDLLHYLMKRCHLGADDVMSHQQINIIHTKCPGKYFPIQTVVRRLKSS